MSYYIRQGFFLLTIKIFQNKDVNLFVIADAGERVFGAGGRKPKF